MAAVSFFRRLSKIVPSMCGKMCPMPIVRPLAPQCADPLGKEIFIRRRCCSPLPESRFSPDRAAVPARSVFPLFLSSPRFFPRPSRFFRSPEWAPVSVAAPVFSGTAALPQPAAEGSMERRPDKEKKSRFVGIRLSSLPVGSTPLPCRVQGGSARPEPCRGTARYSPNSLRSISTASSFSQPKNSISCSVSRPLRQSFSTFL